MVDGQIQGMLSREDVVSYLRTLRDSAFSLVVGFEPAHLYASLSGLENDVLAPIWNRLGTFIFRHGEHFYSFQGVREYKEKFDPKWERDTRPLRAVLRFRASSLTSPPSYREASKELLPNEIILPKTMRLLPRPS